MWLMYVLSWIALFIQILFLTIGIAAGLYYIAELVEEYTVVSKKVITWITLAVLSVFILLLIFEELSFYMIVCGIITQAAHLYILSSFPLVEIKSPVFITAIILFLVNHYLAFSFFLSTYYNLSETLAYFTICLWLVPFSLFVSLSANENVLPTVNETSPSQFGSSDILSSYLSRKSKKYGLLSLFQYANEHILPQRNKKMF